MKRMLPLIALMAACSVASAQRFELDPEFGSAGINHSDPSDGGTDEPAAAILLPDGKILVVGETRSGGQVLIAMARFKPDGLHDRTFGLGGTALAIFSQINRARGAAIQSDGKILVAGVYSESNAASRMIPALYRFEANGLVDTAFGNQGVIARRFDPVSSGQFFMVDTLSGGRILAAGMSSGNINGGTAGAGVQRFLADGTPDSTYGTNGLARIIMNIQGGGTGFIRPDGKVVIPVLAVSGPSWVIGVARFDSSGNADVDFGDVGQAITNVAIGANPLHAIAGPNGTTLVGATSTAAGGGTQFTVVRIEEDGDIDPTFGEGGVANVQITSSDQFYGLSAQADGRILLAGASSGGFGIAGLARLTSDGDLDTSFGNGGTMLLDANGNTGTHYATKALEQPDGKIVVAGFDFASRGGDFLLARLTSPTSHVAREASDHLSLGQNSPNPFSDRTTICYDVASPAEVTLVLFDPLGRQLRTIGVGRAERGSHCVEIERGSLADGVYYYQLRVGDRVETRPMVIEGR